MHFPREIGLKRAKCDTRADMDRFVSKMADKTACYVSLYGFTEQKWNGHRMMFDYRSAVIDRAWWDFDGDDGDQVKLDAAKLIGRLEGEVYVVATGRGFHVHQPLRETVTGDRWPTELVRYEKQMAEGLLPWIASEPLTVCAASPTPTTPSEVGGRSSLTLRPSATTLWATKSLGGLTLP